MPIHRPYHHGDLRQALLERAEQTLREGGLEELSLRELARATGVSHAAPRRHFADRQALLDALAVAGFEQLTGVVDEAIRRGGPTFRDRFVEVAVAYVTLATANPSLLDLMFTGKHHPDASEDLAAAAQRAFSQVDAMIADAERWGEVVPGDPERVRTVCFTTVLGLTTLTATEMVPPTGVRAVVADVVDGVLAGLAPRT